MKLQPNRLDAAQPHAFHGRSIDRSRPLRFTLNGRLIEGFRGDTVLSAALAAGVTTVGSRNGAPMALSEHFAPAVLPLGHSDSRAALPMERLPARDGMELITLGAHLPGLHLQGAAARLRDTARGWRRSLGHRLDALSGLPLPFMDLASIEQIRTDVLVVGAGVAGMGAARAAALAGEQVLLVDRRPFLGGDARFFGTLDGEEAPDAMVSRLAAELSGMGNVRLLLRTDVLTLFDGVASAHRVELDGADAVGKVIDILAKRVVLACGASDRLPIFPGNRLPGVVSAINAFHRADHFGIWAGRSAVVSTTVNAGYRLAQQAVAAGVNITQLTDSRLSPRSRFVEFAKAYGVRQSTGLVPDQVRPARKRQGRLDVQLAVTVEDAVGAPAPLLVDQLVLAGGWQPQLTLWHMAGGQSRWSQEEGKLLAQGGLPDVTLAGAAAGYRNAGACLLSGGAAVAALLGQPFAPIDDTQLDLIYESLDAALPVSARTGSTPPAYLDHGMSLTTRPARERAERPGLLSNRVIHRWPLAEQSRSMSLGDVAAGVLLGLIPKTDPGVIVQERCIIATDFMGKDAPPPPIDPDNRVLIPAFLQNRFGPRPGLWLLAADHGRPLETGVLLYAKTDRVAPTQAIGVVLRTAPLGLSGSIALISQAVGQDSRAVARQTSGTVNVRLVAPFDPDAPLPVTAPEPPESELPAPVPEPGEPPPPPPPPLRRVPGRRAGEAFTSAPADQPVMAGIRTSARPR